MLLNKGTNVVILFPHEWIKHSSWNDFGQKLNEEEELFLGSTKHHALKGLIETSPSNEKIYSGVDKTELFFGFEEGFLGASYFFHPFKFVNLLPGELF